MWNMLMFFSETTKVDKLKLFIHDQLMIINTTSNNCSVISWWSVLLVEETGISGKKRWLVTEKTWSQDIVSSTPSLR